MKLIDQIQNKASPYKFNVIPSMIHYTTMMEGQVHVRLPYCHEPTTSNTEKDLNTSDRVRYLLRDLCLVRSSTSGNGQTLFSLAFVTTPDNITTVASVAIVASGDAPQG